MGISRQGGTVYQRTAQRPFVVEIETVDEGRAAPVSVQDIAEKSRQGGASTLR